MSAVAGAAAARQGAPHTRRVSWTPVLRWGSLAAAAAALAAAAVLGEAGAIATAVLVAVLGYGIIRLIWRGEEREFLLTLFSTAFAVRTVGAVISHFLLIHFGQGGFLLMDDRAYDKIGWTLARVWMGVFPGIRDTDQYLMVNYTYMVAAVYYWLGHSLLAAKMLNVAFGSLLAVALYALGSEIFGTRVGRLAAVVAAFFPSLLMWSIINLKDILVVLLTTVAVYGLVRYARRHEWWALALCLGAFLAIENLRQFVFFILAWLMPVAFLFADRSERDKSAARLILAVVLGAALTGPLFALMWNSENLRSFLILLPFAFFLPSALLLAGRSDRRQKLLFLLPLLVGVVLLNFGTNNEKLGTNFLTPKALTEAEWKRWVEENKADTGLGEFGGVKPPKEMDTIASRTITALPRGLFYVLLGPTPWEARSASTRVVIPEMLVWYVLLGAALAGIVLSLREKWRDLVLPLGFAGAWIMALALTEGNTGNIFRHRSQFMPFVFLMASVGLLWLWSRWQTRKTGSADQSMPGMAHPTEGIH